jgi:hypothetical protein
MSEPHQDQGPEGIDALPGIARLAASTSWRATGWALQTSLRSTARLLQAATSPTAASELADDVRRAASSAIRDLLDVTDVEQRVSTAGQAVDVARKIVDAVPSRRPAGQDGLHPSLRDEGEELLRRSRDVRYAVDAHPAYERILSELAPDEGRVLRLMLVGGPQPAVDVRTGGPLGLINSRLIAPGLSMIGARAGCRYPERVPSYLNNLFRLGMVWFSRETLKDPLRYQVLEAQPDALEAIHSVRQAKVVRRSIHLTPFGEDFCRVCLTPDDEELDQLPEHSAPPETQTPPKEPADAPG